VPKWTDNYAALVKRSRHIRPIVDLRYGCNQMPGFPVALFVGPDIVSVHRIDLPR
jgi:hypothetical protein